jgi:putative radical SAM enzyme (TIGR03279 family)
MHDRDIDRIIEMHISPVNVSVHTTNPELRKQMMHNKRAGEVLGYLKKLADAGISLCAQIVLCKGLNDGAELDRSLHDLIALHPALESVAVVPAGLTQFREGLYPLEPFNSRECAAIIKQINAYGDWCLKELGTRLVYPSDEFYLKAGLPLPNDEYYESYSQIENGVGMLTDMKTALEYELEDVTPYSEYKKRTVSIATGYAAYEHMCGLAKMIEDKFDGVKINVHRIKNNFFGELITVSGLLTAQDLYEQLRDKELGDEVFISSSALRAEGDVFLDDVSPEELSERLSVKVTPTDSDACDLLTKILGIN